VSNRLYIIVGGEGKKCRIVELGDDGMRDIASFPDVSCNILLEFRGNLVVSEGNALFIASGDRGKPVLRSRLGNWFWHVAEARNKSFYFRSMVRALQVSMFPRISRTLS